MFFIFTARKNLQRGISLTRVRADFRFAICALTLTYIVTASIRLAVSRCNDFCILSYCVLGLKTRTLSSNDCSSRKFRIGIVAEFRIVLAFEVEKVDRAAKHRSLAS